MRNKKTIKEFRAFYIMASSVYAKSSWEVIIPRITVIPGWISW